MSAEPTHDAAPVAGEAHAPRTRPYYWSVRRELWENPAFYMAPLVVVALGLLGFLASTFHLARNVRRATETLAAVRTMDTGDVEAFAAASAAAAKAGNALPMHYYISTGFPFVVVTVVAFFYCLGALHGERRDRTILFWKSLPVSDTTTVLAKATLPLVISPIIIFAVAFLTHIFMLSVSSLVLLANGISPGDLLSRLPFPYMWLAEARGLIVMSLWWAPIVGYLLLVSAWARHTPILWALGPWGVLIAVEYMAQQTLHIWGFLLWRLTGGFAMAFTTDGKTSIDTLADLDPRPILASPDLWLGLLVAAFLLMAAVRLRRYRDPI